MLPQVFVSPDLHATFHEAQISAGAGLISATPPPPSHAAQWRQPPLLPVSANSLYTRPTKLRKSRRVPLCSPRSLERYAHVHG